jgi:hypothetical protein
MREHGAVDGFFEGPLRIVIVLVVVAVAAIALSAKVQEKIIPVTNFHLKKESTNKERTGENGIFTIDQRKEMEEISVLLAIS